MLRLPTRNRLTLAIVDGHACLHFATGRVRTPEWEEALALDSAEDWPARFEVIAECLRRHALQKVDLRVMVGDSLVRYAIVPWQRGRQQATAELSLARACFEHRYGGMADWELRVDGRVFGGGRLASALRADWLGGLRSLCERFDLRCRAVLPAPLVVWNALLAPTQEENLIYAFASPEQVFFLTRRTGAWAAVHTVSGSFDASTFLQVLQREAVVQGFDALPSSLVFAPHIAPALVNGLSAETPLRCIGREWDLPDPNADATFWLAMARVGAQA